MANNENVSTIPRKGKPSGNGREADLHDEEAEAIGQDNANGIGTENTEVRHPNRHLHKGEDVKQFKDREE